MTWHLKDRELEKKLEEFTGGDFVNSLNCAIEREDIDSEFFVWVAFGRKLSGDDNKENCLLFRTDELEEVPEYNPHGWNNFPEVTPPENVRMRVEFNYKDEPEKTYHACFYFFSGKWYWDTCKYSIASSIVNIRFRPWEG